MSETNPYAPPATSEVLFPNPRWYRRDGKFVVVRTGAVLPARCVKTNEKIGERDWFGEKQLVWIWWWAQFASPVVVVMALFVITLNSANVEVMLYAIGVPVVLIAGVLLVVGRKTLKVTYGLARRIRRRQSVIHGAVAICAVAAYALGFGDSDVLSLEPQYLLIAGVIIASIPRHFLRAARYRDGEFWLKGCSPEFLDSLDEA